MRWARRQDSNHSQIADALLHLGCGVLDVSRCAGVGCDLVVWRADRVWLVEVKDGALAPSRRLLTDSEAALKLRYPGQWRVVASVDEAVALVTGAQDGRLRRLGGPRSDERMAGSGKGRADGADAS